jgi:hypothetical protein
VGIFVVSVQDFGNEGPILDECETGGRFGSTECQLAILANDKLVNLVRGWPALTEKKVAGIHFVQEDSPDEIGRAIANWMRALC